MYLLDAGELCEEDAWLWALLSLRESSMARKKMINLTLKKKY